MSTQTQLCDSDPLLSFCERVVERSKNWPPAEDVLADEFLSFFRISESARFETLSQLCVQIGITVSVQSMPSEIRGHNSFYNGSRTITIAERQSFPGANEHTLLHELRELLEHSFVGLGFAVAANPEDLEKRAELFACLVRSHLAQKTMFVWLEHVGHVEKKWLRYGAYVLTALGGIAMIVGCFLLPVFEDQASEYRRQRSLDA